MNVLPLGRRLLRTSAAAILVCLAFAAGAGTIRLLPWLVSPELPASLALGFARTLCSASLEVAWMLGLPLGCALGAVRFCAQGEARALMALGIRPRTLVLGAAGPLAMMGLACCALLVLSGSGPSDHGRLAEELIRRGRESCSKVSTPRVVAVPLLGVAWVCAPEHHPHVTAPVPGLAPRSWFVAHDLVIHPGSGTLELPGLRVVVWSMDRRERLRLEVGRAVVSGLIPWRRSAGPPVAWRSSLVAGSAWVVGLLTAWLVIATRLEARSGAVLLGALPGVAALGLLHRLDRAQASPYEYLFVPSGGLAAILLVMVLARGLRPLHKRWREKTSLVGLARACK